MYLGCPGTYNICVDIIVLLYCIFAILLQKEMIVPENWQFEEARKCFTEPKVLDCKEIKV